MPVSGRMKHARLGLGVTDTGHARSVSRYKITWPGTGRAAPGIQEDPGSFREPAGLARRDDTFQTSTSILHALGWQAVCLRTATVRDGRLTPDRPSRVLARTTQVNSQPVC